MGRSEGWPLEDVMRDDAVWDEVKRFSIEAGSM